MTNENQKKQNKPFQWKVKDLIELHPDVAEDLQEVINLFMESEEADDQHIRIKALNCLNTVKEIVKTQKAKTNE
jgi:hypothetical protein